MNEPRGQTLLRAEFLQLLHSLEDEGTLIVIIHRQLPIFNRLRLCTRREARKRTVEAQRQQRVFPGGVRRAEAELLREALVGQPCLLPLTAEHAHAGTPARLRVGDAGFHQPAPVAVSLRRALHPQAIQIIVLFSDNRHPRRFQRRVLDERAPVPAQLQKYVPLRNAPRQPRLLRLNPRMRLFHAHNAA